MQQTLINNDKVGKMAYTSSSMLRLENFREELLRIKKEHYFGLSDVDFAREIGLSAEGYRKIVSPDKSPEYTRSSTIYAIALRLNMDYEIKEEGKKTYIYFHKKKFQEENLKDVTLDKEIYDLYVNLSVEKKALFIRLLKHMSKEAQDSIFNLIKQFSPDFTKEENPYVKK